MSFRLCDVFTNPLPIMLKKDKVWLYKITLYIVDFTGNEFPGHNVYVYTNRK